MKTQSVQSSPSFSALLHAATEAKDRITGSPSLLPSLLGTPRKSPFGSMNFPPFDAPLSPLFSLSSSAMPMSASSLSLPGSAHTTPEQPTTRVLSQNNPPAAPSYQTMGHGTSISALASAALSPSYTQSNARSNAAGRKATFTSAQMAPSHSSQPQTKKGKLNTGGAAARADSPLNSVSAKKAKLSASDVAGGSSCHQCKSRRSANDLTYCTSSLDKKKKSCRKKYCEHCLKKFYKESAALIATKKEWKCPSCRKLCCCAACRRKETKGKGGVVPSVLQSLNLPMSMALGLSKLTNTALAQSAPNKFGSSSSASKPPLTAPPSALGTMLKSKDAAMKPESSSSYGSSSALLSPTLPGLSGEPPSDGAFKESSRPLSPPLGPQAFLQFMTSNNQAQNQCFALLYAVANLPNVNKHIQYYLSRRDITDGQKVESIANLLRALAPSVSAST